MIGEASNPPGFPRMHPRVAVIGTTGSGKTTLARELSQRLAVSHVELDSLHWDAGWTPATPEEFRRRVEQALRGDAWVVDGNYGVVRDIVWGSANAVVWLDYPLWLILARLLKRTFRRVFTGEELWNGNKERFGAAFFSRDSLFLWALQTYRRRRREYPVLFRQPEYGHLSVVRLPSPSSAREWLNVLSNTFSAKE